MKNRLKEEIKSILLSLVIIAVASLLAYGLYITQPSKCRTAKTAVPRYCVD